MPFDTNARREAITLELSSPAGKDQNEEIGSECILPTSLDEAPAPAPDLVPPPSPSEKAEVAPEPPMDQPKAEASPRVVQSGNRHRIIATVSALGILAGGSAIAILSGSKGDSNSSAPITTASATATSSVSEEPKTEDDKINLAPTSANELLHKLNNARTTIFVKNTTTDVTLMDAAKRILAVPSSPVVQVVQLQTTAMADQDGMVTDIHRIWVAPAEFNSAKHNIDQKPTTFCFAIPRNYDMKNFYLGVKIENSRVTFPANANPDHQKLQEAKTLLRGNIIVARVDNWTTCVNAIGCSNNPVPQARGVGYQIADRHQVFKTVGNELPLCKPASP